MALHRADRAGAGRRGQPRLERAGAVDRPGARQRSGCRGADPRTDVRRPPGPGRLAGRTLLSRDPAARPDQGRPRRGRHRRPRGNGARWAPRRRADPGGPAGGGQCRHGAAGRRGPPGRLPLQCPGEPGRRRCPLRPGAGRAGQRRVDRDLRLRPLREAPARPRQAQRLSDLAGRKGLRALRGRHLADRSRRGRADPVRGRRLEAHRPQQRAARLQRHRGRPPNRGARGPRHRPGRLPRAAERPAAQAWPPLRGPQLRQPRARLLPPRGCPGRPGDRGPDRDLRREPAAPAPDAGARPPGGERGRTCPPVPRRLPHGRAGGARDRGDRIRPRAAARLREPGERIRPQDPQDRRGRARGHAPRRDRHGPRGLRTPRPGGDRAHLPGAVQPPRRSQGRVRAAGRHRGNPGRHPSGVPTGSSRRP